MKKSLKVGLIFLAIYLILTFVAKISQGYSWNTEILGLASFPGLYVGILIFGPNPSEITLIIYATIILSAALFWFLIGTLIGLIINKTKTKRQN